MTSAQVLACPQAGQREVCPSSCYLTTLPSPSQANTPTPFTPCSSMALDLGWPGPGKRLDLGTQGRPGDLRQSPGRAAAAIVGAYSTSCPEIANISEGSTAAGIPATT